VSINLKQYQKQTPLTPSQSKSDTSKTQSISDFLNRDISFFGNQLSMKKKESFYAEAEVLLKAGLDLRMTLQMVEEGQKKEKDKALFAQIQDHVVKGDNLSRAMERTGKFSEYEVNSLKIAEESGRLVPILQELSLYFAKNLQYRRLLVSALSYPALVITVALLAVGFLLNFLVPLFGDIYARLDQELPPLTLIIVELSAIMNKHLSKVLVLLLVSILFIFTQRKKDYMRKIGASLIIRLPVFGGLIRQIYLARFCQSMAFLLNARVPVLKALALIKKMIGFYPIEQSLISASEDVTKGQALNHSLSKFKIYPHRMITLLKVGEEANQLEAMFLKLAEQYNDDVEQRTKMLGSLIEPILIVFLALVVGLVLVAMYLPIFKLVSNFGV